MEKDVESYETKARLGIEAHDKDIKLAEKLITTSSNQALQATGSTMVD